MHKKKGLFNSRKWLSNEFETKTAKQIAGEQNCTNTLILRRLKEFGITKKGRVRVRNYKIPEKEWLVEQCKTKPFSQIARELKCSPQTVGRWAKKYEIKEKYKLSALKIKKTKYPLLNNKEWLRQKYVDEKLSQGEIAKIIGCKGGAINYFLFKHGIPSRTHLEDIKIRDSKSSTKGPKHWNWKGGKIKHKSGYILIRALDHPNATNRGYIMEHRLIMEKYLGRLLKPTELIHHKNGDPSDNRIENLEIVTKKQHSRNHFDAVKEVAKLKNILDEHGIEY